MVHFCKLCQLLHKNMDSIECDSSNVWLLESVFKLKIVPVNGRVEPICQSCIRKYNKVMRRKRKENGGFPISQNQIFPISTTTTTVTSSTQLVMMQRQEQLATQNQGLVGGTGQHREEDSSTETSIVTANSFQLNITGAAAVYRTGRGSSDEDSSAGKSSDVDDDDDDDDDDGREDVVGDSDDDSCGSSECCSDGSEDSSSSCSSSSVSESSSETRTSLVIDESIQGSEEMSQDVPVKTNGINSEVDQGYATLSNLKNHLNSHLQKKPYECNECGRRFTQKSSLKTHLDSHRSDRDPIRCDPCGQEFPTPTALYAHRRTVHKTQKKTPENATTYDCSRCGRSFKQLRWFRTHMKREHHQDVDEGTTTTTEKKSSNKITIDGVDIEEVEEPDQPDELSNFEDSLAGDEGDEETKSD
ncbi:gastrula zinc finger protein XlCGF53.1 [Culex quinquefasciatus]|uniref:gastrula zinc finger protein XlCGF53.1 n=1 Tax=Culex quinquefasciatus TaxID=7176 RepID=UPI0018E37A85|nr:gastrula zinc finger protein XlCGF53.1 [Culex quinquefasciatus]